MATKDIFNIDSALSEEERAVRDSIRQFVDEKVIPVIGKAYVEGKFPREIIPQMAELGVFGANLPEEYGCAGLNNVAYGLINQELERGDSGVRSFASVQGSLVMYPIYAFGSDEQKKHYLPKMLWSDGARLRIESVGNDHPRKRAGGWKLDNQWREDVDHQWIYSAGFDHLGQDWRFERRHVDSRLYCPD